MNVLPHLGFMGLPGGLEWIVVLVVALLLFGRRLPDVMRSLGSSAREFKKGIEEGAEIKDDEPAKKSQEADKNTVARDNTDGDSAQTDEPREREL